MSIEPDLANLIEFILTQKDDPAWKAEITHLVIEISIPIGWDQLSTKEVTKIKLVVKRLIPNVEKVDVTTTFFEGDRYKINIVRANLQLSPN
jgi:hypothetical protein